MTTNQILSQKSLVTVFVYVPAGLGHLRVTEALYDGLPESSISELLGSQEKSTQIIHRLLSIHPLLRYCMQVFQHGALEDLYTYFYRAFLRSHTRKIYLQLQTILDERIVVPKTVLVIASHFAHAYQIAEIKNKLEKEKGVKVILIVQVTDDSPQDIWYINGADIIFVPSIKTKDALIEYGKKSQLDSINFQVNPYPISPVLTKSLSQDEYYSRIKQMSPFSKSLIYTSIPISGAAVGTEYYKTLIDTLSLISNRYHFTVIAKSAPYTKKFLNQMLSRKNVTLNVSEHDRGIVAQYEDTYKKNVIGAEITKPSEQAFKALVSTKKRGGSILFFSSPVGRQEYDNLDFLRRNHLIPTIAEANYFFHKSEKGQMLEGKSQSEILKAAGAWRGLELPENPINAAKFIEWSQKNGILTQMAHFISAKSEFDEELSDSGVKTFWEKVAEFLEQNTLNSP